MESKLWKWVLGLTYIFAVGAIWIAASFVVQSVVDAGVSPFLITYTCNSLFVIYIPLVEIGRYVEDTYGSLWFWQRVRKSSSLQEFAESEKIILLEEIDEHPKTDPYALVEDVDISHHENAIGLETRHVVGELDISLPGEEIVKEDTKELVDTKGRWTRTRTAKVSLLICPFWFLAQLAFNLSLKYTTVTSNTILSSSSSLFTFMVALAFLGEKFTWLKLMSVLLCMGGTIIVSLGDSQSDLNAIASNPFLGDILALLSAALYAAYITLIRKKFPDDDEKSGRPSMALFLGFLGLFNLFIFLPIALILNFSKLEPFYILTWKQVGLIVGKGLLDNVLSDYLWAKAVLLTSTTVATAGLTIQVPMAAVVDSLTGNVPHLMDYIGALAVMIGFAGMNVPNELFSRREEASVKLESENANSSVQYHNSVSLTAVAVT